VPRKQSPKLLTWCSTELIRCQLKYAICLSEQAFKTEMVRLKVASPPPFMATTHANASVHYFSSDAGELAILCMDLEGSRKRAPIEVAGLLVHEAVHIFQQDCEYRGEKNPSAEYEAYSIQMIAQELMIAYTKAL
jgi:hypothetical protein